MELLAVLLVIALIGSWVLGVVGFFRALSAHAEIATLRRTVEALGASSATAPRELRPASVPEVAPPPVPEQPEFPATISEPAGTAPTSSAFVTPALVQTEHPSLPGLFGYLLVVTATALAVVRYTAWIWLGWATTIAGAVWVLIAIAAGADGDNWAPALFVPAAAALNLALLPGAALDLGSAVAWPGCRARRWARQGCCWPNSSGLASPYRRSAVRAADRLARSK